MGNDSFAKNGTWTDLSNRVWDRYYDANNDCIVNMSNHTSTSVDFHQVTKHTRRLLEFASEVAFSSEDIPAHSDPVTIASANTVYAPDHLDSPNELEWTPPKTFAEYISQLPEWERDLIKGNREVKSDYHKSLSQCILTKTKLYMVHDGGHIPDTDHGSYGWVLASNDGTLWEGWGKARGHSVQSFHCQSRNKWRDSFLSSLDEEMKKWLTVADIRREILTGLQAWFEQTDNTLEAAAAAEDTNEDDPDGEDSDNDSDYNIIDTERDAQEDDDDEGQLHPKPKVPPSYEWSHFFRGYIDTSWVESHENLRIRTRHPEVHRQALGIQAYQVPMAGRSRGLDSTM
jgi:hypothetical protein